MKSKLISSFFTVFTFWWTILFFATKNKGFDLLTQFLKGWAFSFIAALCGVVVIFMLYWLSKEDRKQRIEPSMLRGMSLSLGPIPLVKQLKRNNLWSIPSEFSDWHSAYKKEFPKHAALLNAGISIMKGNPCQASPVKGGHGDVNLLTHSYNVLREIISMAPSWNFKGSVGSGGNILLGLTDPQYVFDSKDPVIPLVAFLHDLGKIVCYKTMRDGSIKQVLDNHDIHGGKLIININEFWELSKADRDLLILSITYYHHPSEMPLWADDRSRAVMELMIKSDNEAGKKEGGVTYYSDSTFKSDDDDATNIPLIRTVIGEDGVKVKVNERNEILNGGFNGDRLYKGLRSLLSEPDRINGREHPGRIGFKANGYVYLQEERLRQALASSMDEPTLLAQQLQGGINPNTTALMEKLDSLGVLYVEHNGLTFGAGSAFWNTVHKDKSGKTLLEPKYVIIIKSEIFPGLDNMSDCPAPPEIVKPTQGWKRARNKDKAAQVNENTSIEDDGFIETGVGPISFDDAEDITSSPVLDYSDLTLLMEEAKETETEDIAQFKINTDMMSSLLDEDEVVAPTHPKTQPVLEITTSNVISTPAPLNASMLLDDDEPIPEIDEADPLANTVINAPQPEPEMQDELDDVELEIIQKLHTGKVGFETPFKKKTYEGHDYFMYALIILKGDYVNDWDYFLSQVKRGEIPDVIWRENVQKDIYLGFKGK